MLWHGVMWFGVMLCPVVWFGDYVQVMGMHSVSSPYASYHMLNKSLFDKNNKSYNRVTTRMTVATQNDRVSTQLRASFSRCAHYSLYGGGQWVLIIECINVRLMWIHRTP